MKKIALIILASIIFATSFGQNSVKKKMVLDPHKKIYILEAACGNCQFKMKGNGCNLAVKYKEVYYFVEGTDIDDHGDAHDKDGFCNAVRKAKVQGEIKGDKFLVTYFELLKSKE